jgi:hypothetical protein
MKHSVSEQQVASLASALSKLRDDLVELSGVADDCLFMTDCYEKNQILKYAADALDAIAGLAQFDNEQRH